MDFFKTIERINVLHKLIGDKRTGNPGSLSKKLGISLTTLYSLLEELKSYDAPITYSRSSETFYYTKAFEMDLYCIIKVIDDETELKKVVGGYNYHLSVRFFVRKDDNFVNIS